MDEKLFEGLTPEQKTALKNCKTKEELMALIDREGLDLSDEQMEAIGGGCAPKECCHDPKTKK